MSYDLTFLVGQTDTAPSAEELQKYFAGRKCYDSKKGMGLYSNETTGVYFGFEAEDGGGDPVEGMEDAPELKSAGVAFNINYCRPHIFALEAEPELAAIVSRFNFCVFDPQVDGMGIGQYSRHGFLQGWTAGNDFGYRALVRAHRDKGSAFDPPYLPAAEIERCWRWNYLRDDPRWAQMGDFYVPRIFYIKMDGAVCSMVSWPDAISIALPRVDYLYLQRKEITRSRLFGSLFGGKQDCALIRYEDAGPLLSGKPQESDIGAYHLLGTSDLKRETTKFFVRQQPFCGKIDGLAPADVLDLETVQATQA